MEKRVQFHIEVWHFGSGDLDKNTWTNVPFQSPAEE